MPDCSPDPTRPTSPSVVRTVGLIHDIPTPGHTGGHTLFHRIREVLYRHFEVHEHSFARGGPRGSAAFYPVLPFARPVGEGLRRRTDVVVTNLSGVFPVPGTSSTSSLPHPRTPATTCTDDWDSGDPLPRTYGRSRSSGSGTVVSSGRCSTRRPGTPSSARARWSPSAKWSGPRSAPNGDAKRSWCDPV